MKKCPYCKAEIDSDAKFCVYCMRSLEAKQTVAPISSKKAPWYLWLILLGLTLVAVALIVFIPPAKKAMGQSPTSSESAIQQPAADSSWQKESSTTPSGTTPASPYTPDSGTGTTAPTGQNPDPTSPASTTVPTGSSPTTETTVPPTTTTPTTPPTTTQPTTTPPAEENSIYSYRLVASGEEYNAGYVNSGNDIIITGVKTPNGSGIYDVPAYIDGMRVLVIAPNAFSGSGARQVYLPSTVKTIWGNAFSGCPLTDIYFRGSAIYAAGNAFSGITGSLTIHCSANCSDRNYRYYKNTAPDYGAVFAEWNG